jgi:hypothetical protein
MKILKKLEKVGPKAFIQMNLYQSTKEQLNSLAQA